MSAKQCTDWQAYESVEPFGERAHYWRTGQICAAIHNSQRTKKSDRVAKAEDFMPDTFRDETDEDASTPTDDYDQLKAVHDRAQRGIA